MVLPSFFLLFLLLRRLNNTNGYLAPAYYVFPTSAVARFRSRPAASLKQVSLSGNREEMQISYTRVCVFIDKLSV